MFAAKCDGCHEYKEVEATRGFPPGWGYLSGWGINRSLCGSCLEIVNAALPKPYERPVLTDVPAVDFPPEAPPAPLTQAKLEAVANSPAHTLEAHVKGLPPDDPLHIACKAELARRGIA